MEKKNPTQNEITSKHFTEESLKEDIREKEKALIEARAQKAIWNKTEKNLMEEIRELKTIRSNSFANNNGLNHIKYPNIFRRL